MKRFAALFDQIDRAVKTTDKISALTEYFKKVQDEDKLWVIALLSGKKPKRIITVKIIREWAQELSGLPVWLYDESHNQVGDIAETVAILLPDPKNEHDHSLSYWIKEIKRMDGIAAQTKKEFVIKTWASLGRSERFIFNKLISGGLRLEVSRKIMVKALARYSSIEEYKLYPRLIENWDPECITFDHFVQDNDHDIILRPYHFYQACKLNKNIEELGDTSAWLAERKWDGIRAQIVKRNGQIYIWAKGEELITDQYPEFNVLKTILKDDLVMDGEILPYSEKPLPFADMQKRRARKTLSKKIMKEVPVIFMAFDLIEIEGRDMRQVALEKRRAYLNDIIDDVNFSVLKFSEEVCFQDWEALKKERLRSKQLGCEGLILKKRDSVYRVGEEKEIWWIWKTDPYAISAVLLYATRGEGRQANLYSEYTFAVRQGKDMTPIAKANMHLNDDENSQVNQWIRENTIDRFGPVMAVKPQLIFEIEFDSINRSSRHKSGIVLKNPRIIKWRHDSEIEDADSIETLQELVE